MKKTSQIKKLFLLLLVGFLFYSCSENEPFNKNNENQNNENFVDLSQAQKIGESIYFPKKQNNYKSKGSFKTSKKTIKSINQVLNNNNKTSYYIINYNKGGFILLSADNRTQPILGYSEKGEFNLDENSYPLGLQFWVKDAKKQILQIQNSNIKQSNKEKIAWKQIQNTIINQTFLAKEDEPQCYEHTETHTKGPLLNSAWYQTGGFNTALPYITCDGYSKRVLAGCVPIAMAQIMRYHEHPTNYNWSAMPSNYGTTTTANFIKDIHDAIRYIYPNEPSYNCFATGVSASANMGYVLKNQFNYSSADWGNFNYQTVENNISQNNPVILSGDNGATGHMWACDGYKTISYHFDDCTSINYLYFYMNWGWGGNYNGWFAFDNFNPGNTHYNNNKKMIYNITP